MEKEFFDGTYVFQENEKGLTLCSDGTYILQETEEQGKFLFFREDGGILENIDREPMEMYQNYICMKLFSGEIAGAIYGGMGCKISEDKKVMFLSTTMEKLDIEPNVKSTSIVKKENSVKQMIKSIFKSRNK